MECQAFLSAIDDIRGIGTALKVTKFEITPVPAPRNTKNSKNMHKWTDEYCIKADNEYFQKTLAETGVGKKGTLLYAKQRAVRYIEYKMKLKQIAEQINYVQAQDGFALWFLFPVTKSWTKKKKKEMIGSLHKLQLDSDNLVKGFFDGIMPKALRFMGEKGGNDDRKISSFSAFKIWCPEEMDPCIYIAEYPVTQYLDAFWKDILPLAGFDIKKTP